MLLVASDVSIQKGFLPQQRGSLKEIEEAGLASTMNLKLIWLLVVLLSCASNSWSYASMNISREEDLELERQLKVLNKPAIKIILTNEGDIIDCVDIYKQPAFDHPLLKNHQLQLKPSSFPTGLAKASSKMKSTEIRFMNEACPSGTVPIKRTLKEDLIRTKFLSEQPPPINLGEDFHFRGSHVVSIMVKATGTPYSGGTARVALYNLSIAPDQSSSTNMWVANGPPNDVSFITTGWKVSQGLNGDGVTRLFTYWTGGGYKTGCYNTLCPGFVVTNKEAGPNVPLDRVSIRGDPTTFTLKLLIFQDPQTGNWWLSISERDVIIGYWPKEIFNHLRNGANRIYWGAETNAGRNGLSPPMGNGYKPDHHFRDTCYFRQVRYINEYNDAIIPSKEHEVTEFLDKSGCYDLENKGNWGDDLMGYAFMFGGPGGNCGL